jgi:hypothetical protein
MADIFTFPSDIKDLSSIDVPITPRPEWDEARVAATLKAFNVDERERSDTGGARLVVRDTAGELEIFRTSDSLRWSLTDKRTEEPAEPVSLPEPQQARALAARALAERGLTHAGASVTSVTDSVHSRIGKGNVVLSRHPVARHVNYTYQVNGLPVFGPGAKMQVTFGDERRPAQIYSFWREPAGSRALPSIGYDRAVETIRQNRSFATMVTGGRAEVIFDRVALGYYSFPAREVQGLLIPVYRFDGSVAIPELERPHVFTRYVTAIQLQAQDVKAARVSARGALPDVFSS